MKKQAIQLLVALGLVVFCVAKATAKFNELRATCATLRSDVDTLQVDAETHELLILRHEAALRRAGIPCIPELLSGPTQGTDPSEPPTTGR